MARKAEYGRGHSAFINYVNFIVGNPTYSGMPDAYLDDGSVQWEAPSNRSSGKFQFTHQKRLEWWRRKAVEIGIDPNSAQWISRVAKAIHPTKRKPCKQCGREMDIRYVYPSAVMLVRLMKTGYFDGSFPLDPLDDILIIVTNLHQHYGDQIFSQLPTLFNTTSLKVPQLAPDLETWLLWLEESYIPSEPRTLSPGVMSNPPDRFDGFHSFNRCCRSTADKGRSKENLRSYVTDRRVFEYWVDGNWVAADRLMGLVRSVLHIQEEACLNGHPGPCQADHIGPISLGFAHRPEFQLLCQTCNSSKNNRMTMNDITLLRQAETAGIEVASWYCQDLWKECQTFLETDEHALRLSKLLRDNRHTYMTILRDIVSQDKLTFLSTLLGLAYAEKEPEFINLHIEKHITVFDRMSEKTRGTKYVLEQQARRVRIAFESLHEYFEKSNRNEFTVRNDQVNALVKEAKDILHTQPSSMSALDLKLQNAIEQKSEEQLRNLVQQVPASGDVAEFREARRRLESAMEIVAELLLEQWNSSRYVRVSQDDLI